MQERNQRLASLAPLYEKEYRIFIIARFFYIMALRMVATVVAYQLFQLTQNSFSIGLVGLSEFIPVFLLALYAGHVIDRSDKRTMLVRGIFSYSVCVIALIIVTTPSVMKNMDTRMLELSIYSIIFFTGIIRAFAGPTSSALISQLVPRPMLHLAANLSSTTWLSASILGHASCGFFIAWFGVNVTFCIILFYILIAGFVTSRISKKTPAQTNPGVKTWDSVKEGLQYVFNHKILLSAISLDLFAVLFGGIAAMIPEFSSEILKVGPIGFGWLNAAMDIGSAIMILTVTFNPLKKRQGRVLLYAVGGYGICILVFGLSDFYILSFGALLIAGMLDGISVMIRGTILQLTTPDHMRGRVGSVNSMFVNSSNELGQFESGFADRIMGTVPSVLFGGCMTLLVVVVTWFKAPGIRRFEYGKEGVKEQ
jgi:MFS family permease